MRVRIDKNLSGKAGTGRKEAALRINKSGLSADGKQRYVVAIRFTNESYKKATKSEYVVVEVDHEEGRLYFLTGTREDGYKLTSSTKSGTYKSITFSVPDIDKWMLYVGDYDMLKDVSEGIYYIDFSKK